MIQVVDAQGFKIPGLFKTSTGSIVVVDELGLKKNKQAFGAFDSMKNDISLLNEKLDKVMQYIHSLNKQ